MTTAIAIVFVVLLGLMVPFQLALAFGAPLGRFAWGGQHDGVLPPKYRIGSAISILIYVFLALLALDRVGLIELLPVGFSQVAMWVVFGFFVLSVLMNGISRSKSERYTMAPLSLVLAILALLIALSGAPQKTFEGMVLDNGTGPVFCTVIMESYPPQCPNDSPAVHGWDWNAVDHEQEQSVRWGDYRFEGTQDAGGITVSGAPAPQR